MGHQMIELKIYKMYMSYIYQILDVGMSDSEQHNS